LRDKSGRLELENVRELRQSGEFLGGQSEPLNFGFTESAYWFHVQLDAKNPPEEAWVLESLYPIMDHLQLYVVYPDGNAARFHSGTPSPSTNAPATTNTSTLNSRRSPDRPWTSTCAPRPAAPCRCP